MSTPISAVAGGRELWFMFDPRTEKDEKDFFKRISGDYKQVLADNGQKKDRELAGAAKQSYAEQALARLREMQADSGASILRERAANQKTTRDS